MVTGNQREFQKAAITEQEENTKNILQNTRISQGSQLEKQYGMLKEKFVLQFHSMKKMQQKLTIAEKEKVELEKKLKSAHSKLCEARAKGNLGASQSHVRKGNSGLESRSNFFAHLLSMGNVTSHSVKPRINAATLMSSR